MCHGLSRGTSVPLRHFARPTCRNRGLILQQTAILEVPSVPSMKAPRCVIYHRCRVCCSSSGSGGWGAEVGHKAYLEMSIPPTLATECGVPLDQKIPYGEHNHLSVNRQRPTEEPDKLFWARCIRDTRGKPLRYLTRRSCNGAGRASPKVGDEPQDTTSGGRCVEYFPVKTIAAVRRGGIASSRIWGSGLPRRYHDGRLPLP